jgi:hypothetical protein
MAFQETLRNLPSAKLSSPPSFSRREGRQVLPGNLLNQIMGRICPFGAFIRCPMIAENQQGEGFSLSEPSIMMLY